jgi:SOS-response transcriptional repressor LexA
VSERPDREREILDFIGSYLGREGYPPTVREVAAAVGLRSPASVHSHLRALQRSGRLVVVTRGGHVKRMEVRGESEPR